MDALRRMWSGEPEDARAPVERFFEPCGRSRWSSPSSTSSTATRTTPRRSCPTARPAPLPLDDIRVYEPSTRPGSPLPHAWIDDEDGNRRALRDLVAPGRFLLIAGEDGDAWCTAARELAAESDLPVDAVRIGHLDGDLFDPRCTWLRQRGIGAGGAVLVRPDRFVAWRSPTANDEPRLVLGAALDQILGWAVTRQVRPRERCLIPSA